MPKKQKANVVEIPVDELSIVTGIDEKTSRRICKFEMQTTSGLVVMYLDTFDVESLVEALIEHLSKCEDSTIEIEEVDDDDTEPRSRKRCCRKAN